MKKAFTLTEILVIIAIIGIISATLVPTLSRYLPGVELNGSTRVLSSDLREAQERSVTEQKQYGIIFNDNATPQYYQLVLVGLPNTVIRKENLSSGESVTLDATIANKAIVFSPDGGPSSSGNITLTLAGAHKIVNVSPAGFIKIQ